MSRSIAFRRHQQAKAKTRARNLWVRIRQIQEYVGGNWRVRMGEQPCEPTAVGLGIMASTHCKPCSCYCCGNPRRHHGGPTPQELRAQLDDSWLLDPGAWRDGPPLELEYDSRHFGASIYYGFYEAYLGASNKHPRGRNSYR